MTPSFRGHSHGARAKCTRGERQDIRKSSKIAHESHVREISIKPNEISELQ